MISRLIIHSSAAVSLGVRIRNQLVFALSWVLWGAMLLQLVRGFGQHHVPTARELFTHWVDPWTAPALDEIPVSLISLAAVLVASLGWSRYQRRKFRRAQAQGRTAEGAHPAVQGYDSLCPTEVVSRYFGVDPQRMRILQRARNVVIHHDADGRVVAFRPGERAPRALPTSIRDAVSGRVPQELSRASA